MSVELDRWQFERRLHHCVEYRYWEKLQRLRVRSGRLGPGRRRSSAHNSQQRPRSQPELRHVPAPNIEVSDKAFLRKVSAKPGNTPLSSKTCAAGNSGTNCPATKSVTFMLPRVPGVSGQAPAAPSGLKYKKS